MSLWGTVCLLDTVCLCWISGGFRGAMLSWPLGPKRVLLPSADPLGSKTAHFSYENIYFFLFCKDPPKIQGALSPNFILTSLRKSWIRHCVEHCVSLGSVLCLSVGYLGICCNAIAVCGCHRWASLIQKLVPLIVGPLLYGLVSLTAGPLT